MVAVLNARGRLGVVMPHGVLFREAGESRIRQGLLQQALVEAVIGLREAAAAERRSLSNFIATLKPVRKAQFVDDAEMAEILNDDALIRRLRTGSRQARRRKGGFVATSPTREQSPDVRRRDGFRDRRSERD